MSQPIKTWAAAEYNKSFSFVTNYGLDLIPLLDPKKGERILDIGCGTGKLTGQIAEAGAKVIGIDQDEQMLTTARKAYPGITFLKADAQKLTFAREFDAVFSNAALHWMLKPRQVINGVHGALKPGGRFVAEMGGDGNVYGIQSLLCEALQKEGVSVKISDFHYFPTVAEYSTLLEKAGFEVQYVVNFERPTPLEGGDDGLNQWIRMFATLYLKLVPEKKWPALIRYVEKKARPALYSNGRWHADYKRLRFKSLKG